MPTKATFDGNKAKFILTDLDIRASENQSHLLDLLERLFGSGREDDMKLVVKALQNNSVLSRVITLLRAGKIQEAEDVVMDVRK